MNIFFFSLVHEDLIRYVNVNDSIPRNPDFIIVMWQLHVGKTWHLFDRCKGHGSGCTTALGEVHRYFEPCVLSNTALPVLWQHPEPAQIISGSYTKSVPAAKIKAQSASNTSTHRSMPICWLFSFSYLQLWGASTREAEKFLDTRGCVVRSRSFLIPVCTLQT